MSEVHIRVLRKSADGPFVASSIEFEDLTCTAGTIDEAVNGVLSDDRLAEPNQFTVLWQRPNLPPVLRFMRWLFNWRSWPFWVLVVLTSPIGYVLSVGPFVGLYSHDMINDEVYELVLTTFYAPLVMVYENSDTFETFIDWYVDFFAG